MATTLADISNSYGTALAPWVATYGADNPRSSVHIYPNQDRPNQTVWNVFVKQLRRCFCTGTNNQLTHPLGCWFRGHITQTLPQVYSPSMQLLYSSEANGALWMYHSRNHGSTYRYLRTAPRAIIPRDAVPISGGFQQGHFHPDTRVHQTITAPPQQQLPRHQTH